MQQPVEVFSAIGRRGCEERAFMLMAVGIDSEIDVTADGFALFVEQPMHAHALHHLAMYEQERQRLPARAEALAPRPGAWWGSLVYVLVLLVPPFALAREWFPVDPYQAGALHPELVRGGEWWRIFTALTLHWDAPHLLGNLGGGALLGHCAAQVWGSARAWMLIVLAAACANLMESLLGRTDYLSAGASTAVFAALGLVAAFAWRARGQRFGTPLTRWAPLVAGIALLGLFGAGSSVPVAGMPQPHLWPFEDEGTTNVLSHLLGFACGAVLGAAVAVQRGRRVVEGMPGWLAVALSTGPLLLAWWLAMSVTA